MKLKWFNYISIDHYRHLSEIVFKEITVLWASDSFAIMCICSSVFLVAFNFIFYSWYRHIHKKKLVCLSGGVKVGLFLWSNIVRLIHQWLLPSIRRLDGSGFVGVMYACWTFFSVTFWWSFFFLWIYPSPKMLNRDKTVLKGFS